MLAERKEWRLLPELGCWGVSDFTKAAPGVGGLAWVEPSAEAAREAMGCCQGKDFQTSDEQAKEAGSEEVQEGGTGDTRVPREPGVRDGPPGGWTGEGRAQRPRILAGKEGVDADSAENRNLRSHERLLITVLWRRLSLFSRRGSSRSNKRQSVQNPKQACTCQECNREGIQE